MEWRFLILLSAIIAIQSGCSALDSGFLVSPLDSLPANLKKSDLEAETKKEKPDLDAAANEPSRMAIIWKENILQSESAAPVKGFSGRVYFYDKAGEVIKADGELNVYGYDDSQADKQRVADKHFIFEAGKFTDHYSPSELGHCYSIWIPWETYGGYRKSITLIPVFRTPNNKVIQGNADYLSLSGKPQKPQTLERTIATPQQNMAQGPYQQNHNSMPLADHHRRAAESIPVPRSITEQWNRMDLHRTVNQVPLVPENPNTMNALNRAAQQPDGSGYNQVQVQQQVQSSGQILNQNPPRSSNTRSNQTNFYPQSNWQTVPTGQAGYGKPENRTANAMYGNKGVHASLGDTPADAAGSRVFGKPGAVR